MRSDPGLRRRDGDAEWSGIRFLAQLQITFLERLGGGGLQTRLPER